MNKQTTRLADECRAFMGEAHVLTTLESIQSFADNLGGQQRDIPLVLRPADTGEVQAIVRHANRHRVTLYPFGCGHNWGLGSRLPVTNDCALLDLSRMRSIHEVNTKHLYAIVEPGVTQADLHEYLEANNIPLRLNITGAGRQTSVIGNALDRGIGYFASRADALCALEVVLGTGELIETGHAHYAHAKTKHIYRHGTGPSLDGLFSQSNLGIVTRATVDLMPIPEWSTAVLAKINDDDALPALVEGIAELRRNNIITSVIHIGDRERSHITLAPMLADELARRRGGEPSEYRDEAVRILEREKFGSWTALIGLTGARSVVSATCRLVKAGLSRVAEVQVMSPRTVATGKRLMQALAPVSRTADNKAALLEAMAPLFGMAAGIPSDAPLKSLYWPLNQQPSSDPIHPDSDQCGMLYCLPFMPLTGEAAAHILHLTRRIFGKHDFTPYMTFNIIDAKTLELVVNLAFNRADNARTAAAQQCVDELTAQCAIDGYIPYRVGIDQMHHVVNEKDPYWQRVSDLKQVFDPNHIIAPGRYNLV